jgi:hypothetical protein
MIGYFPDSYPNELFYSLCARFSQRMQIPTITGVMQTLFGRRHTVAIVDLPNRLDGFVASLPPGSVYTSGLIIQKHTLLPYYSPFIAPSTRERVQRFMRGGETAIGARCGSCLNRVRPPLYFRSCPDCDAENRKNFGETYWNRLFQITGVEVCPIHKVFLESSDIRLYPLSNRHCFFSAEGAKLKKQSTAINHNDPLHRILLHLAKDTAWLLDQENLNPGAELIRARHLALLKERDLATQGGSARIRKIKIAITDYFTPELLEKLQSGLNLTGCSWIEQLLHTRHANASPLRQLLLMNFLKVTPEAFFYPHRYESSTKVASPFQGPWLCQNPACESFRKPTILACHIETQRKQKSEVAILCCPICRYTYVTRAWRQPEATVDYVREFGPVWISKLRELWTNEIISLRALARYLGVDSKTAKQYAHIHGLEFPRRGKRPARMKNFYQPKPRIGPSLDHQRAAWLVLKKAHPDSGPKDLRMENPALFAWLYRNDHAWLTLNQPIRKKAQRPNATVDWATRDETMACQIANIAWRIKNRPGKAVRVSATTIGREMGKQSLLENRPKKLPLTRAMILSVVETAEAFALRRIARAATRLRRTIGTFERWQLIRAAGLRKNLEILESVQAALYFETVRSPQDISVDQLRSMIAKEA